MAAKSETLKVSEMAKARNLDDASLFLVVQNGHGSKLTFADLKNAVIKEVKDELEQQHKDIEKQKNFQESVDAKIDAIVQKKMSEFSDNIVASVRSTLENSKKQLSFSIERYHKDSQDLFGKFKKDIDADNLPKLFTKNADLSKKITQAENARKKAAEQLETSFEKIKQELNLKIEEAEEKLTNRIAEEVERSKKLEQDSITTAKKLEDEVKSLVDKTQQLDVRLYGVTVEEIDPKTAEVSEKILKEGDVSQLLEKVVELSKKVDQLSKKISK